MKKKKAQKLNLFRVVFQTMPIIFTFGLIIAFEGYDLYFSDFDLSLGFTGSFLLATLVCFVVQIFVNVNPILKNTRSGIFVGTILTIELMLFLLFAQYHFWVSAVIIVSMVIFSGCLTGKIIEANERKRKITGRVRKKCNSCTNAIVAYLLCFVLILPAGIGVYEEYYKYSLSAEEWSKFVEWFNEEDEKTEEAQKPTLPYEDKLAGLNDWDSLSVAEKERLIRTVALIEKDELGISNEVEITVFTEKMNDSTCGYYEDSSKEIFINYKYLNEGDMKAVLKTILHEMHHAFVHYTVENIDYESEFVKENFYYKQAWAWKENTENYISAEESFEKYKNQPIESDARTYAEERVNYYLQYIENNDE
ncbi:MAG: hypothetical protein IJ025_09455 [Clostridia bacterium]|nr:hypothetical protein [Clostridia bacterium]